MYFTSYLIFGTCIVGFNLACKTFTVQEYYATKTYYESFMSVFTESSTDDDLAYGDEFNAKEHIVYEYHTAHTVTLHEIREKLPKYVDTIRSHGFNPAAETKIFVHGFLSEASIIRDYANAYLRIGQYNFFGVNWTEGSSSTYNYYEVKEYVPKVAKAVAYFIYELVTKHNLDLKKITLVGHSLGAHVVGIAGKRLQNWLGDTIPLIFGLDPAKPQFDLADPTGHIFRGDGDLVYIIHTGIDGFGIAEPIGDVDVYPNNGKHQPGCKRYMLTLLVPTLRDLCECSHVRAHDLHIESLVPRSQLVKPFVMVPCESYEKMKENPSAHCRRNLLPGTHPITMGGDISPDAETIASYPRGIFHLTTNAQKPFSITPGAGGHAGH